MSAIYSCREKNSRVYVITTNVYLYMTNLLFDLRKNPTNGAKAIYFLTNIESVYFSIFEHNIFAAN